MRLGQQVKQLRQQRGLTVREFAELVGIDKSSVSDIERGANVGAKTLWKMRKTLSISIDDLLDNIQDDEVDRVATSTAQEQRH